MQVRSFIVPLVQLAAKIAPWIFFSGFILGNLNIAWAGIALFATQPLFTLVTLPVEYDASNRAQKLLLAQNIVVREENIEGLKKVLGAAAWTYVVGAVSALGTLLYFVANVEQLVAKGRIEMVAGKSRHHTRQRPASTGGDA